MKKLLNKFKTKNIVTGLVMVSLFALIIGISFAAYNYTNNANDNVLKSGQIKMTYTEPSNTVILKDALPKEDELGKSQTEYFEFSVMSNATTNVTDDKGVKIPYEISLSKVAVDASLKQLEDNQIKIYLTKLEGEKEEEVLGPILISELDSSDFGSESLKIYNTINHHKNNNGSITTRYRLRFWVDENVDISAWSTTGEYEYKFKVNVNGKANSIDVENTNALAYKIKNMYTVENGSAVEEDGYHYLKGIETESIASDPSSMVLAYYGMFGNVYLYRQEVEKVNVEPVANIKKITDTKEYTYNQELLEHDFRYAMISSDNVSEEEYDQMTGPFGGYVNAMLGMFAGVVDEDMQYVDGYTIDDIPTLDEAMADETMKEMVTESFSDFVSMAIAYNKDSFNALYLDNGIYNEELLNANLELGYALEDYDITLEEIKPVFGTVSNWIIAIVYELVDDGDQNFAEGKTIEDIPKLSTVFAADEEKILLTNTYVKLNGILWKVLGINKDETIKLMSVSPLHFYHGQEVNFIESQIAKYLGYNNYEETSPFLQLIKGTTLEDIIIKTNYEYEEYGEKEKVFAYASLPTYEDIKNSMIGDFTYLCEPGGYDITVAKKSEYFKVFYNEEDGLSESNLGSIYGNPTITIKNIDVIGEGTKDNPYMIENEIISSSGNIAKSMHETVATLEYYLRELYLYEDADYQYELDKSEINQIYTNISAANNTIYATGMSINNKCYYNNIDGVSKEIEYSGNCGDKFVNIASQSPTTINTYSYNETKLTVSATNAESYRWQQKVGDEWIDLEDYTGRISGSQTNTLTIIPTSYFDKTNYYRCVVVNDISKKLTSDITVNIELTDGEWVYKEIEDTNKFQIVSYKGDYKNSQYFTLLDDGTNYHAIIPSVINGDTIETIESFYISDKINESTWRSIYPKLTSVEFLAGIKEINAPMCHLYGFSCSYTVNNVILPEGLEKIGSHVFKSEALKEINLPSTIKEIGEYAFSKAGLTELELPASLKTIGNYAFEGVKLTSLKTNNLLETIGERAFYDSVITELKLPEGLKEIGISAFYKSQITELEIPSTVKTIGTYTFYFSPLTNLKLNNGLETIDNKAFYSALINDLEIPTSVKTIGEDAFFDSPLTNLVLHEGLTNIGNFAFYSSNLTKLEIPASVEIIGDSAFRYSELITLTLNEGLKEIGSSAFIYSKLTELELPSTLIKIGANSFSNSQLKELVIPDNVIYVDNGAFSASPLERLELSSKLTYIGSDAFYNSKLTELEIPNLVTMIASRAFYSSPLTKLILHENLKEINDGAFYSADLKELSIPSTVTSIRSEAFKNSLFTDLKIYGKTSLDDFEILFPTLTMADGYEPQFISGTLE